MQRIYQYALLVNKLTCLMVEAQTNGVDFHQALAEAQESPTLKRWGIFQKRNNGVA